MVTIAYLRKYFEGKKVLLTGHTGFKGSWLLQMLSLCKANIMGLSLRPETISLYNQIQGDDLCNSILHDIRDAEFIKKCILEFEPDFIFHLAAQPLVLDSYERPLYTFEVNAQGTANILEALRFLTKPCVAIMITTDKVYENKETGAFFKEEDKLGGYDPYSASKAAAEIIINSYTYSFFNTHQYHQHQKSIASLRAGNVIGGGDYAANRIIPDIIQAIKQNKKVELRNPNAIRPWQHVLEPLSVYLLLATKMVDDPIQYATSFNIGPESDDVLSVEALTQKAIETLGHGEYEIIQSATQPHEAGLLMLDIAKVKEKLNWLPQYTAAEAIAKTVMWYDNQDEASIKCLDQINSYFGNNIDDFNES